MFANPSKTTPIAGEKQFDSAAGGRVSLTSISEDYPWLIKTNDHQKR
jgi:hypothetical protein